MNQIIDLKLPERIFALRGDGFSRHYSDKAAMASVMGKHAEAASALAN